MAENKMEQVESLLKWLASGEKDEDGNWLNDNDTQLVCDALEYYLNMHGQQNKMEQVAEMFGKKLGEEFYVMYYRKRKARFTLQGVEFYRTGNRLGLGKWVVAEGVLEYLITGEAVIVDGTE